MKINVQKRLAADIMGCSGKRVLFDTERLPEIKEAITKADIKGLIKDNAISKKPARGVSRGRARLRKIQKRSGRRRGHGSRKGTANARAESRIAWKNQIRGQRILIKILKEKGKITKAVYRSLYEKAKGGFFRSKKHLKLYIEERNLTKE